MIFNASNVYYAKSSFFFIRVQENKFQMQDGRIPPWVKWLIWSICILQIPASLPSAVDHPPDIWSEVISPACDGLNPLVMLLPGIDLPQMGSF